MTALDGPLAGVSEVGTFTIDSSLLSSGGDVIGGAGLLLDLAFTWNGVTYDATTANTGRLDIWTDTLYAFIIGNYCWNYACGIRPGREGWDATQSSFAYTIQGDPTIYYGTTVFSGPLPQPSTVPEPMSLTLLGSGLAGLVVAARRRRRCARSRDGGALLG